MTAGGKAHAATGVGAGLKPAPTVTMSDVLCHLEREYPSLTVRADVNG